VLDALDSFETSLITPNARFDKFLRGQLNALSSDELDGYQLFNRTVALPVTRESMSGAIYFRPSACSRIWCRNHHRPLTQIWVASC